MRGALPTASQAALSTPAARAAVTLAPTTSDWRRCAPHGLQRAQSGRCVVPPWPGRGATPARAPQGPE